MYSRRESSKNVSRAMLSLVIIVGAILAFTFYQSRRPASPSMPTATQRAMAKVNTRTATPQPTPKRPSFYLSIEKANVLTTIVEVYFSKSDGWDLSLLNQYVGHLQGTPRIGQGGNVVLAGHIELMDGTPGAFARLNVLKTGDLITVFSDDPKSPAVKRYAVTAVKTVNPNALDEIRNHGHEELTLVTCLVWDDRTRTYQKRLVVHARPL